MIKVRALDLVAEANRHIKTLSAADALKAAAGGDALLVDIRDVRELDREGMVAGAYHAPRGMLEFWVDPASPYHRPELLAKPRLIFYCGSGWRSALAAQAIQAMGHPGVAHVEGGFTALKAANAAVVPRRPHKPAA